MSNQLSDVEGDLNGFIADVRAKVDRVEAESLPVIHSGALALEQLTQSKVVGEIQQLAEPLDPELDTFLAGIVRTAGEAAAKIAALTAPPAETPSGADAEPDPA